MSDLCCPVCHAEFDLAVLVKHAEDRDGPQMIGSDMDAGPEQHREP